MKRVPWRVLLVLGGLFQLFLSLLLWNRNGNIPPGFDDAYAYTFLIEKVVRYRTLFPPIPYLMPVVHLQHISYSALLGGLALFLNVPSEQMFRISFFALKIVLIIVVWYWCKTWFKDAAAKWAFGSLMLFIGNGEIHGFFWVAPSLLGLLGIFIWFTLMRKKVTRRVLLFSLLAGFITAGMHQLAYVGIVAGWLFLLIRWAKHRRLSDELVIIAAITIGVMLYLLLNLLFNSWVNIEYRQSQTDVILSKSLNAYLSSEENGSLWNRLRSIFSEFWETWFYFFPALVVLPRVWWVLSKKQLPFLDLLVAALIGGLGVSLTIDQGYRSLLLSAVLMNVLLGLGIYYMKGRFVKLILIFFLLFRTSWDMIGLWQGRFYNDEYFDKTCLSYVEEQTIPGEEVYFTSQSGLAAFSLNISDRRLISAKYIRDFGKPFYLVTEQKAFEGRSDKQIVTLKQLEESIGLKAVRDCGFFSIHQGRFKRS